MGGEPPSPYNAMGFVVEGAATIAAKGLPVYVNSKDADNVVSKGKVLTSVDSGLLYYYLPKN